MIDKSSLAEKLEGALREDILRGRLEPGRRLSIDELMSRYGTSSTPVRDAVKRLGDAGFLEVSPRRSIHVSRLTRRKFLEIFELRVALEPLALRRSAESLSSRKLEKLASRIEEGLRICRERGDASSLEDCDSRVHDLLVEECANLELRRILVALRDMIVWARNTVLSRRPGDLVEAGEEHLAVLRGLLSGDVDGAAAALEGHLRAVLSRMSGSLDDLASSAEKVSKRKEIQ